MDNVKKIQAMPKEKKPKVHTSGRKQVYGEPTTTVAYRIPISKVNTTDALIHRHQEKWKAAFKKKSGK